MAPTLVWKLGLALALVTAIICSASARAPRKPVPRADLRWLLLGALALYAVGLAALVKHHSQLAVLVFAAGITASTLAAWLSRGSDAGGGPPRGDEPVDEHPPPDPNGVTGFDWDRFERELLAYTSRTRDTVRSR